MHISHAVDINREAAKNAVTQTTENYQLHISCKLPQWVVLSYTVSKYRVIKVCLHHKLGVARSDLGATGQTSAPACQPRWPVWWGLDGTRAANG